MRHARRAEGADERDQLVLAMAELWYISALLALHHGARNKMQPVCVCVGTAELSQSLTERTLSYQWQRSV